MSPRRVHDVSTKRGRGKPRPIECVPAAEHVDFVMRTQRHILQQIRDSFAATRERALLEARTMAGLEALAAADAHWEREHPLRPGMKRAGPSWGDVLVQARARSRLTGKPATFPGVGKKGVSAEMIWLGLAQRWLTDAQIGEILYPEVKSHEQRADRVSSLRVRLNKHMADESLEGNT